MDITISVNLWFLISMCLVFAIIGMIIGARTASRGSRHF